MKYQHNDGGRVSAGFKGKTGDCVTRAIAIATGQPYEIVYNSINREAKQERTRKYGKRSSARTGVFKETYKRYLAGMGWQWHPTMGIGTGCRVHLRDGELPMGRLLVSVSRHLVAVVDGVINDTYDCSREGTRCVYGYWTQPQ